MKEILGTQKIGKTGYIYCNNTKGTSVYHPEKEVEGKNWMHFDFIQKMVQLKTGYLEYMWKNPGEDKERPKAVYMVYFKPLDWIISVSTYKEEFKELVAVDDIRETVLSHRFGETGYVYVFDLDGNLILHPELEGGNVVQIFGDDASFIREMLERKSGKITYWWKNPGEAEKRQKKVLYKYLPELDCCLFIVYG
jgi:two-component system, NtrC family, sensor kinase